MTVERPRSSIENFWPRAAQHFLSMRMEVALRRETKPPQINSCRNGAARAEVKACREKPAPLRQRYANGHRGGFERELGDSQPDLGDSSFDLRSLTTPRFLHATAPWRSLPSSSSRHPAPSWCCRDRTRDYRCPHSRTPGTAC